MIGVLLKALLVAGIPVAAISYALVWWALRNGYLGDFRDTDDIGKRIRQFSKARKSRNKRKKRRRRKGSTQSQADPDRPVAGPERISFFHNKWLAFGGGFYGVLALLTYLIVEGAEIVAFFARFDGLAAMLSRVDADMLIGLLIGAVTNFVVAVAWPVYWLVELRGPHLWAWFLVAYAAYWLGVRLALKAAIKSPAD